MGEKEIKPATGGLQVTPTPGATGPTQTRPRTQEKPGTGKPPVEPPIEPPIKKTNGGGGGGRPSSWSGSVQFEDGYTMGRSASGDTYLDAPDGTHATWDAGSESWKGADGKAMPDDWSAGHRPTDYGPAR